MTTSGLTYDPKTGLAILPPDGSNPAVGGTPRTLPTLDGTNSNGSTAPAGDPYSIFAGNVTKLLSSAQQNANPAPLYAQKDALTNESLNLSNPLNDTPYKSIFAGMTPNAQLNAENGTEQAFAPGITSTNDQIANASSLMSNFNTAAQTAYEYNKPVDVAQGSTLTTQGGKVLSRGQQVFNNVPNPHNGYLPDTQIVNPDGSITWASGVGNTPVPSTTPTLVGGVDFSGTATSTQPYAEDPNYTKEMQGTYSSIQQAIPTPNAQSYDQYIQAHAKSSPVTGSMILTAASTYNVDPNILAATLQHESDFGTAGAGAKTMNAGNVGNTGTSTRAFNSWQQGVNATAAELAKRMPGNSNAGASANYSAGSNSPTQTQQNTSALGGNFNPVYSQKVAKLPTALQSFADAGPNGVAYVNDDRVPANLKNSMQIAAQSNGIPYLGAADVASLQSLTQAQQNMSLMKTAANNTLGNGFWGGVENIAATGLNHLTLGNAFPSYGQFNSYASAAIGQLKALAGSGGGFRITQSEIDTAQNNMPESTDTLSLAKTKMQVLQGLINTTLAKIFPDAPIPIMKPDGTQGTVSAQNYSKAINLGATPI